jgi:hypothetical protein
MHVGDTWTYFNQLYWNGYIPQEGYEAWRKAGMKGNGRGFVLFFLLM